MDRPTRNAWRAQEDPRWFDYRNSWLRWPNVQHNLQRVQDTSERVIRLDGLYNRSNGLTDGVRDGVELSPDTVVLYDGIYPLDPELYPPGTFDLQVLLDVTPEESRRRQVARDAPFGKDPATVAQWFDTLYLPRWRAHVEAVQPERRAQLVYDTTDLGHPVRLVYEAQADGLEESWQGVDEALAQVSLQHADSAALGEVGYVVTARAVFGDAGHELPGVPALVRWLAQQQVPVALLGGTPAQQAVARQMLNLPSISVSDTDDVTGVRHLPDPADYRAATQWMQQTFAVATVQIVRTLADPVPYDDHRDLVLRLWDLQWAPLLDALDVTVADLAGLGQANTEAARLLWAA